MEFTKYQHVERLGTAEVNGITEGKCYIFHKLDGTNGSIWMEDGIVCAGSRNRKLALDNDNAGFYAWVLQQDNIKEFFMEYPDKILYGEWLVPHSFKNYRDNAWRKFYVFDVGAYYMKDKERTYTYVSYTLYQHILDKYYIDYIPPITIMDCPDEQNLIDLLPLATMCVMDGQGAGEGIVVKNYEFENRFGRTTWAKIVSSEFKEKHNKFQVDVRKGKDYSKVEKDMAREFVTDAFVEKEYAKIVNEVGGWESKLIPRLLGVVFHELIREESWEMLKKFKFPTVHYGRLRKAVNDEVKRRKPDLF